MSHWIPIPDTVIDFDPRQLKFLRDLVEKEKEACRVSLRATGRWTERLEQHVDLLLSGSEKLGGCMGSP